jgi:BppU N-terminal domain
MSVQELVFPEIHVGVIGMEFLSQIKDENNDPVDVTSATIDFKFKKPSGALVNKVGVAGSIQEPAKTGVLGWVRYTTIANDLDSAGNWHGQVKVTIGTNQYPTNIFKFTVHANL